MSIRGEGHIGSVTGKAVECLPNITKAKQRDIHMYDHSFLLYFKAPKGHETRFTYMAQGDII